MKKQILIGILLTLGFVTATKAQNCVIGAGVLNYIVRDQKGKIMSPSKLSANPNKVTEFELSEDENPDQKQKIEVVSYGNYNPNGCGLRDETVEMTLVYKGKTMVLIFKGVRGWRRVIFDSLPFQKGKFEIETNGEKNKQGVFLAKGWKKII